ncbi:hypothetical protein [Geodermatophilus pulveris]|uniref:hypothetical protein n=1 Tax=Geodermatophilus pulveris TaxID=1564159 RepID=UPI0015C660C5|nr:hypothetical protein [Geodermatophilus pulveris]
MGPTAERAADLATTWGEVSAEEGADLVSVRNASLGLAAPAAVPVAPERPRPVLYSSTAAVGGGLLAALVLVASGRRRASDEDTLTARAAPAADLPPRDGRLATLLSSHRSWLAAGAALAGTAAAVVLTGLVVSSAPPAARAAVGLLLGALAGAVLAVAALVVYDRSRGLVLLSADAVQATGADIVVQTTEPRRLHAATGLDMRFRDLEPYRGLHRALAGQPQVRVVLVVGDSPGAQPALRSIDVAVAGANAGERTVLVGARTQAHRRSVGEVLRKTLEDDAAVSAELVPTDRPHLRVLPLDWPDASDVRGREALESRRLPLLVDRLLDTADLVVLSGPPLTEVSLRLAAVADAAVLVVVAGSSTVADCRRAADRLARAGSRVIGVVLVHRGHGTRTPVIWNRPRQAVPDPEESGDDPSVEDAPTAADELAGALRDAGAGSGRAGARRAEGQATRSATSGCPAPRSGAEARGTTEGER